MKNEIIVSVLCSAYNHERYIKKCLDSLINQNTDFEYEILIHDDASTDRTAEIIKKYEKKYPNKIFPIYQTENQYSKGNNIELINFSRAKGRYIALCEGDDFWVCDKKLQSQVEFLELNPEYSLCVHAAYYAYDDNSLSSTSFFRSYEKSCTVTTEEIFNGWKFATNSIMYRRESRKDMIIPFKGNCVNGDFVLVTYLALKGKVYYIDELMSAYRKQSVGSLNWVWKNDRNKFIEAQTRFLEMLLRLNEYTEKQYQSTLQKLIQETKFTINVSSGNRIEAKENMDLYIKMHAKARFELWLHYYFPNSFFLYRKTVLSIKKILNIW